MNENNVANTEQSTEYVETGSEFELFDTEYSTDSVESGTDSTNSDGDLPAVGGEIHDTIENGDGNPTETETETETEIETEIVESESVNPLQTSEETNESAMGNAETLNEYDVSAVADYVDYYTTLSTTWESYFAGVLANMGDTDYIAYCLRDYTSSSYSSYTDHYVLVYDVEVEDGKLVSGSYPCMDIYRESNSSGYICDTSAKTVSGVSFPFYGSFGNLSDLRKGVSHHETWAILFAIGFAVAYGVCTRLFDSVRKLRRGGKG